MPTHCSDELFYSDPKPLGFLSAMLVFTSHASIAYRKQFPLQRMMVLYDKLVGRKTPLPKERSNTKTPTTNERPQVVLVVLAAERPPCTAGIETRC